MGRTMPVLALPPDIIFPARWPREHTSHAHTFLQSLRARPSPGMAEVTEPPADLKTIIDKTATFVARSAQNPQTCRS